MTITVRDLTVAYDADVALQGVTAETRPGRVTAVLGPNASGKSTLLRSVIGSLRPRHGVVEVDGRPAWRLRGRSLAARIAYVPQRSELSAAFTVREVITLGRYAIGPDPDAVAAALARLDLGRHADRPYAELSAGQQQRVTLARALAQLQPHGNLVLDEPTAAMDLRRAAACFELLRALARAGATVLVALHDLTAAAVLADDVWLLGGGGGETPGRLVAAGTTDEIMRPDRLERVFGVGFELLARRDGRTVLVPEAMVR